MKFEPSKLWEKAILFWTPAGSPMGAEEAYRNRIVIQISLTLGFLVACVAILILVMPITKAGAVAGVLFCSSLFLGVLACLVSLRASARRLLASNILLTTTWATMYTMCFFFGGLESPSITLLVLVPILAATVGSKNAAIAWTFIVIASWLVLLMLAKAGHQFTQIIIPQNYHIAVFINLIVACIVIVTIVSTYAQINQNLRQALDNNNRKLEHLAGHDSLTNLANRRSYYEQLDLAVRRASHQKTRFALLTIDLNNFKEVNDTHGHATGDQVLMSIATRLKKTISHSDFVARLGGDEFVIITEQVISQDDIAEVANKLASAIELPINIKHLTVNLGASIGVAIYPDHGQDRDSLQESSDRAMYRAKAQGVNYMYAIES